MASQKLFPVFVIFLSLLLAVGAVPSRDRTDKTYRSMSSISGGANKKVTITDDRIEVLISAPGQVAGNASQIFKELKALEERVRALENLHRKGFAFLFPNKSTTDYVSGPRMPSLRAVTGCMWIQSSSDTEGCPFSYAAGRTDNELLFHNYKNFIFWVGGATTGSTWIAVNDGRWHHTCFTWENTAGSWNIYVDGVQRRTGTNLKKGYVIRGGGVLMLGQEQDALGGGLNAEQSFVGEMSQLNLWNRVLSAQQIAEMSKSCHAGEGNVLKWSDFKDVRVLGAVQVIEPSPCTSHKTNLSQTKTSLDLENAPVP